MFHNQEVEVWKVCASFPDYEVSSFGRVRRLTTRTCARNGKILKPFPHHRLPYLQVNLCGSSGARRVLLNRLVCETFNGPAPSNVHHAAHDDGDRRNNRASNLVWKTVSENAADRVRHGTQSRGSGVWPRVSVADIQKIRASKDTYSQLSSRFGVSSVTIGSIRNRKTWANVEDAPP